MEKKVSIGFPQVNENESIYQVEVPADIERDFLRDLTALIEKYNEE